MRKQRVLVIAIASIALIGLYQNCSKTEFTTATDTTSPYAKSYFTTDGNPTGTGDGSGSGSGGGAEGQVTGEGTGSGAGTGGGADGQVTGDSQGGDLGDGNDGGTSGGTTVNDDSNDGDSATNPGPGNSGNRGNSGHSENTGSGKNKSGSGLVECMMKSPSVKIIISAGIPTTSHSNSSRTRVCMSSHACLDMMNEYASARGCSMAAGAPSTPGSTEQCTKIFPGSKGTCHNAAVMSDADVDAVLKNMAGQ